MYAGASTGLAVLRRDGFASMISTSNAGSALITRPVVFSGKYLFVNADCSKGTLRVELMKQSGSVIEGYEKDNCIPIHIDKTRIQVTWLKKDNLEILAGEPIQIKFYLTNGKLYSFWVSPEPRGQSNGYVAAGGPEFSGSRDI